MIIKVLLNSIFNSCNSYSLIIANGEFPRHPEIITLIDKAESVICCDGAAIKLIEHGYSPSHIIGDCDSLNDKIGEQFKKFIIKVSEQNTNDLTKAIKFAKSQNINNIFILGATGLREDHTIANISLIAEYQKDFQQIAIISDYGIFTAHESTAILKTIPKQQISFFAVHQGTIINCKELKWILDNYKPKAWFSATLNEATSEYITICTNKLIIVFRAFELKL